MDEILWNEKEVSTLGEMIIKSPYDFDFVLDYIEKEIVEEYAILKYSLVTNKDNTNQKYLYIGTKDSYNPVIVLVHLWDFRVVTMYADKFFQDFRID